MVAARERQLSWSFRSTAADPTPRMSPLDSTDALNPSAAPTLGLGLDAGGTQTRWALADGGGLIAEGHVAGLSALQLGTPQGRAALLQTLQDLARALQPHTQDLTLGLYAGITGLSDPASEAALRQLLVETLKPSPGHVTLAPDMDVAYRAAFAPGEGYLVYGGTGSFAAFIDEQGLMHRIGGRGPLLGDEGGGHWIAAQALAQIWRNEDQRPGAWRDSAMARRVFDFLGGSDWACSRQFIYSGERGAIGRMALQVAAAADEDGAARVLLRRTGAELARLALVMLRRFGQRPVAVAGRVLQLHALIEQGLREQLPADVALRVIPMLAPQRKAAQLALAARPTVHRQ
jgi:N-acetylglucosamine kinase-like BadF-type ATPase